MGRRKRGKARAAGSSSKAVVYLRVSSKEQQAEGFSIEAQRRLAQKYAVENGLEIVREFVDIETAKQAGRTDFVRMLTFLEEELRSKSDDRTRIVLAEKVDRLSRNMQDIVDLNALRVDVHLVRERKVVGPESSSQDHFFFDIQVALAKHYINNLREESRKGMVEKAVRQGMPPYRAPIGYRNTDGPLGKRIIEPDPEFAPFVRRLFQLYASGDYSLLKLTRAMRDAGHRTRAGRPIPKSAIHRYLRDPVYAGQFYWSGVLYEGTYEPLISRDLFDRVQAVLEEKAKRKTRQQKHSWAFQGQVRCGHCGWTLTAERKKGKFTYYHCTAHGAPCPERRWVPEHKLSAAFREALGKIELSPEVVDWLAAALKESHAAEREHTEAQVKRLGNRIDLLVRKQRTLYDHLLEGLITRAVYDEKRAELQRDEDSLREKRRQYEGVSRSYIDDGVKLLELAQRAVGLFDAASMAERGRLTRVVFSNSTWKDGRLTPVFRQPFDIIVKSRTPGSNGNAAGRGPDGVSVIWLRQQDSNL